MRYQSPATSSSPLVRRVAEGASTHERMRRGEIAEQALGLLQLVAAHADANAPFPHGQDRPRINPAEAN